jgi:hypothetical protein
MENAEIRLASACAELIRFWHEHYGPNDYAVNMDEAQFRRYRDCVEYFRKADLSDRRFQQEIAEKQRSGIFDWFYSTAIPAALWEEVSRRFGIAEYPSPQNLGQAARWILERLASSESPSSAVEDGRQSFSAKTKADFLMNARAFYADVAAEGNTEVGGIHVLLSCSLERYSWQPQEHEASMATLLSAQTLGLRLIKRDEREDDFIDAIRQGAFVVEMIGCPSDPMSDSGPDYETDLLR